MPSQQKARTGLKRKLQEQFLKSLEERNFSGDEVTINGPWSELANQNNPWTVNTHLSKELYLEIRSQFDNNIVREVLLAAAGLKVSRTALTDTKLGLLRHIAERHGFCVLASSDKYICYPDVGKGGWCNNIGRVARPAEAEGRRKIYIASNASLAESAKLLEEYGDDELFGLLLLIPPCCREAFARFSPIANLKQNDLIPLVLDNTQGEMPFDPWVNFAANYFGHSLISFFPCSFRCQAASTAARRTFEMLAECDAAWAGEFCKLQQSNILYTEYQGLHLFRNHLLSGVIQYSPEEVYSTSQTEVTSLIRSGDRIEVHDKHHIDIYRASTKLGSLRGEEIGVCAFW